jgi:hypothetical protein
MKILILLCITAVYGEIPMSQHSACTGACLTATTLAPAVCTGACLHARIETQEWKDENLMKLAEAVIKEQDALKPGCTSYSPDDHPEAVWKEKARILRVTDRLEEMGLLKKRLKNICYPEGDAICKSTDANGEKQRYVKVCLEGFPCKKWGQINEWFLGEECSADKTYYWTPFLRQCWDGNYCYLPDYFERQMMNQDDSLDRCIQLANANTIQDLEKLCEDTNGDISHRLCCALEKPYQACGEYCSISWQTDFVTVCHQKNCCKDCKYNDRPCMELDHAKKVTQYLIDHLLFYVKDKPKKVEPNGYESVILPVGEMKPIR